MVLISNIIARFKQSKAKQSISNQKHQRFQKIEIGFKF